MTTGSARPMGPRPRWLAVVGVVAAVIAIGVLILVATWPASSPPASVASAGAGTDSGGSPVAATDPQSCVPMVGNAALPPLTAADRASRAAARAAADRLVRTPILPPGSTRLAASGCQPTDSEATVESAAVSYRVPGTGTAAMAYVRAHRPARTSLRVEWYSDNSLQTAVCVQVAGQPCLQVIVSQIGGGTGVPPDGQTTVTLEADVTWNLARSDVATVPSSVTGATAVLRTSGRATDYQLDAAAARRIATTINTAPIAPVGAVYACPASPTGASDTVTFRGPGPVFSVEFQPDGCPPQLSLIIDGQPSPLPLSVDTVALDLAIRADVGLPPDSADPAEAPVTPSPPAATSMPAPATPTGAVPVSSPGPPVSVPFLGTATGQF